MSFIPSETIFKFLRLWQIVLLFNIESMVGRERLYIILKSLIVRVLIFLKWLIIPSIFRNIVSVSLMWSFSTILKTFLYIWLIMLFAFAENIYTNGQETESWLDQSIKNHLHFRIVRAQIFWEGFLDKFFTWFFKLDF